MLDQPRFWIISILSWIGYYILFKIFYINKKVKKYIQDGYNDNEIKRQKKHLNNERIVHLVMFISITIVINIISYFKITHSILEVIIVISVGELVLFLGKKLIN